MSRDLGHEIASARTFGRLLDGPVVDTETHTFVRCWPIETNPQMSAVDPFTRGEHSGALLIAEMDRVGVDVAVLIGYDGYDFTAFMERHGSSPADFMGGRAYTRAWAERYPGRLRYVTTLRDPRVDATALDDVDRELVRGGVGVKLFPAYLGLLPDAPEIRTLFELLRSRGAGAIFGFEDTSPPATPPLAAMYESLGRLARDFGDVPIQLNHGGNADPFSDEGRALFEVVGSCPNILVSTSVLGGVTMAWTDGWRYPFPDFLRRLEAFAGGVGADRLAWGSDWPWFEGVAKYPQLLQAVVDHATFLSAADKRLYLGENAIRHWHFALPSGPQDGAAGVSTEVDG